MSSFCFVKIILQFVILLTFVGRMSAATILWSFSNADGGYDVAGSGTPVNFTPGIFDVGNTNGTIASLFNTSSASITYTPRSGTYNIGNAVLSGTFDATSTTYYTVTLTPAPGFAIRVSDFDFGVRSVTNGASSYALRSSIDDYQTDILPSVGSITPTTASAWAYKNNTFSSVTATSSTPVTLRLYMFGAIGNNAGTVNTRIDDVSIVATAVAIPEPSGVLAVICLGGLLLADRRRS
jgi:hypothetical protein